MVHDGHMRRPVLETMLLLAASTAYGSVNAATIAAASGFVPPTAAQLAGVTTSAERARGAAVFDRGGNSVGTIDVSGAKFVTIVTPRNRVQMPINALRRSAKGLTIETSAADLDAAIAASSARQARNMPQVKLPELAAMPAPSAYSYIPKGIDPNATTRRSVVPIMPRPVVPKSQ